MTSKIEFNDQFKRALELMDDNSKIVFITGRAGTGKSTLLEYFRDHSQKNIVVLAPTGVAALNVDGETIHSFFGFKPGVTEKDAKKEAQHADTHLFKLLDAIVIDEISMVRADLLDCVDIFLRKVLDNNEPFGGKKLICIGDLYQLPPVVTSSERSALAQKYQTPYFFSADVMSSLFSQPGRIEFVELETVYRQRDEQFISLLNVIRNRSAQQEHLAEFNRHCQPLFNEISSDFIYLTSTNQQADQVNSGNLGRLPGKGRHYIAKVQGDFPQRELPTSEDLVLKPKARVMFLKNNRNEGWVNGTLGTVRAVKVDKVIVKIDGGETVSVEPETWTLYRTVYNRGSRSLDQEKLGSFAQLPLKSAWAITIHKSQGKTFDRVVIDLGRGAFAAGQVYVALSRCRTLEGIILKQPLKLSHLLLDYRVVKFLTSLQYRLAEKELPLEDKVKIIEKAIVQKGRVRITYLKAKDEKSRREIIPLKIEGMEFKGYPFLGVEAYCCKRREYRTFNVARILELELVENKL